VGTDTAVDRSGSFALVWNILETPQSFELKYILLFKAPKRQLNFDLAIGARNKLCSPLHVTSIVVVKNDYGLLKIEQNSLLLRKDTSRNERIICILSQNPQF
jgi:hypothetical protein